MLRSRLLSFSNQLDCLCRLPLERRRARWCRGGEWWAQLKKHESDLEEKVDEISQQEQKSTIELVFYAIDTDNSGELSSKEFSAWWLGNGGDKVRLQTVERAFEIISTRDGKAGCSLAEFKEVPASVAHPETSSALSADSALVRPYSNYLLARAVNRCGYPRGLGRKYG